LQHRLAAQQLKLESSKKTITLKELYGRYLGALGRDDVDLNWPIGKIIRGPASAVFAVAVNIMRWAPFPTMQVLSKLPLFAGRLRSWWSRRRNVESIVSNFEAVALSDQRHCKVAPDGLIAYLHSPFPCLPNRSSQGSNGHGHDREIVKSWLEAFVRISLNGLATLDDALGRNTDAVLGEKRCQTGRILPIECSHKLQARLADQTAARFAALWPMLSVRSQETWSEDW
jgi:hypothetical protein